MIQQPEAYPVVDREGTCLAWRATEALFAATSGGGKGPRLAGKVLKIEVSSNGSAFAILEKPEEKQQPALRLRWFDKQGRPQGGHLMPWHEDHPVPQFCFNTTATHLLIADAALAHITILNSAGQVVREAKLFDDAHYSNERPLFLAASTEDFFVATQNLPSASQNPVSPVLVSFKVDGQESWRQELAQSTAGGLATSKDGVWILASSYAVGSNSAQVNSSSQFFDAIGRLHLNRPGLFRHAIFSENGERALLLDRRQVQLLRIPSGDLSWQSKLASRSEIFVTAVAGARLENIFALIASNSFKDNRFVFEKARLVELVNGEQRRAATIPGDLIEPVLAISRDGKRLTLAAEERVQYFSLPLENKPVSN